MDSVYGTKKYFHGLSGGGNVYRGQSCMALGADHAYNSSLGRHSPVGPYMHMNKHATYSTDLSVNSQCGYNTWGTINDVRNIAPRLYTSKHPHRFRSFSIILMTAVLIVLTAILSIGGLAFYFSSLKPSSDESIMIFEGSFRILKGDSFSSVVKNNQSAVYRQKVDFYKRFLERSLSDNDLKLTKVDIRGFGDGPLIDVQFILMLDMQNIPQNVHSIEEHIRNSLFLETNSLKSLYKFLKIEPDSVRVKRVTGEDVSMTVPTLQQEQSAKKAHFEKKLLKNSPKLTDKTEFKYSTTQLPKWQKKMNEADIDVEQAPVIQGSFEGSFEITKTDADITAKKTSPTKAVSSYQKYSTTSIGMQLKNKKGKPDELTTTPLPVTSTPLIIMNATNAYKTMTTTQQNFETTTQLPSTAKSTTTVESSTATLLGGVDEYPSSSFPPKLDMSLFTSAPVLDTKPWHPINPTNFQYNPQEYSSKSKPTYHMMGASESEPGLLPRNKMPTVIDSTESPSQIISYHSFTHPVFLPATTGIEKLGSSDVKPYPIPISLIDDVVAPDLKSILPMHKEKKNVTSTSNPMDSLIESQTEPYLNLQTQMNESLQLTPTPPSEIATPNQTLAAEEDDIGNILFGLLELPYNISEHSTTTDQPAENKTQKPIFLNIKDVVLNKMNNGSMVESRNSTDTKPISAGILNETMLYPTRNKLEHIKYDINNQASQRKNLVKTYNETLQAVIVENYDNFNLSTNGQITKKRNSSENIENITLLFDTLASKLGITSSFPTKQPPFSPSSQHKLQHATKPIALASVTPTETPSLTTSSQLPMSSTEQESIVGEAEVEVVDPNKYEEMLSSQLPTINPMALVTLLPVRSNSGIRTALDTTSSEGRRFHSDPFNYREAVVSTGIKVTT